MPPHANGSQLQATTLITEVNACNRAQQLIAVRNVRESSRWYRQLLGFDLLPEHPRREVYDRTQYRGELILQLHAWDKDAQPNLVNADAAPPGHGVLLWFEVGDFDEVVERTRASRAQVS